MNSKTLFGLFVVWLASMLPVDAEMQVWTVTETRHVLRSEKPGPSQEVKLSAARNESESFQILVRGDTPLSDVRLEAGDLRQGNAQVIAASQARLYRQHQLHLENGTYRNTNFQADWYPDPLIPFNHPVTGQKLEGRIRATPFAMPANETHGFWVDIEVPTNASPGEYKGSYRLMAGGARTVTIPVTLQVWDFNLPATPTFVTAFGSPRLRDYYAQGERNGKGAAPKDWAAVEKQVATMLSEHRFNATPPSELLRPAAQPDGSFRIPNEQVHRLREFIDVYHVNALQIAHPSSAVKDPETERAKLHRWLAAFDAATKELNRPQVVLFTYLKDEPNTEEDYKYVQKWGRGIREAKSVVKVMVVEQPWTEPGMGGANSAWGELYGAVDIWCPLFSLHRKESAAQRQALGEMIWTYTALCQGKPTPWWHIDYPLLNYRVPAWMAWNDRMTGLLYWGGMTYWNKVEDPWAQAPFYSGSGRPQQGQKGIIFYGEGSLVYPAQPVGYDGIVPTIRLKALRDSIEDYEYLAILERLGKRSAAEGVSRSVAESFYVWDKNPAACETARAKLAAFIIAGGRPVQ